MARSSPAAYGLILVVGVIGVALYFAGQWVMAHNVIGSIIILIIVLLAIFGADNSNSKTGERSADPMTKYGREIGTRIAHKIIWHGETEAQLSDSFGPPHAVDQKMSKTKMKEIWKYDQITKGRYRLRITLENGLVTHWDIKA